MMMTDEDLRESREGQGSEEVRLSRERLRGGLSGSVGVSGGCVEVLEGVKVSGLWWLREEA